MYRYIVSNVKEVATINIILLTSATLSEATMAELLMLVTEAKVLVMHELEIKSTTWRDTREDGYIYFEDFTK
ncbi:adenosylcobinamide amidohydrolase [Sulfurimonas sp. SAG-AH-194-L11]|nr:adenosylcobinamide amidohydrolase [Sulfurimonas sp. SAG-AH-194-L11]MDF1877623.1 adenosylcobinamide amidohydrolase [Sulfurimonas sp. SAG-AH-194-L11]